jgi:hypothetical protein
MSRNHAQHLKICNNRRYEGTINERLSSVVVVNDYSQHEAVGIYPDEIKLFCEKLLEVPEIKEELETIINQDLKLKFERATKKLNTYVNVLEKGIVAQLVKMTNIATNLKIQNDNANKILDEEPNHPNYACIELVNRLREVLKQ